MAYVALYRKYRSQTFGEVMGQEQVTRTLQGAIRTGRIAHAYLFHGARGCGKTSTARLLARAINCVALDGPSPEPCGVCRMCVSIRDGVCLDVIEMDAASETGIDDVREKIVENVQYAPAEARYKVYIIDEVHDLSAKAFDALLKTLEEPPAHVVFMLATTELHKVPITIRSRCQPYHFKRGTLQDLATAVRRVVEAEGYTADPEAILSIARSAEGSWRDALSLLEQVLAYCDGHVSVEAVQHAIGIVATETLARVTEILAGGRWDETLGIAAELIESGKDVRQLLNGLNGHLRDLLLIAAGAREAAEIEIGSERLERLEPQARLFSPPTLLAMMGELSKAERDARLTNQHRWLMESTLLRLLTLQAGASASAPAIPAIQPLAAAPAVVPRPARTGASRPAYAAPVDPSEEMEDAEPDPVRAPEQPVRAAAPVRPAPSAPRPEAADTPASAEAPAAAPASRFAEGVTHEVIVHAWPRILAAIGKKSPATATYLAETTVSGLSGKMVALRFTTTAFRDRIAGKGKDLVEQALNRVLETSGYKIRCEMAGPAPPVAPAAPPAPPEPLLEAPVAAQQQPMGDFGLSAVAPPLQPPAGEANGADTPLVRVAPNEPAGAIAEEVPAPWEAPPEPESGEPEEEPGRIRAAHETDLVTSLPESAPAAASKAGNGRGSRSAAREPAKSAPEQPSMLSEALALFGGEVLPADSEE
jgi:DNA polymerase-3 subunit gamma/tau